MFSETSFIGKILFQWSRPRWQPKHLNLDRAVEHIGSSAGVALLVLLINIGDGSRHAVQLDYEQLFRWVEHSILMGVKFGLLIEGLTVLSKILKGKQEFLNNWKDSVSDFWQYCCVVPFLFIIYWDFVLVIGLLLLWIGFYLWMLLEGW